MKIKIQFDRKPIVNVRAASVFYALSQSFLGLYTYMRPMANMFSFFRNLILHLDNN